VDGGVNPLLLDEEVNVPVDDPVGNLVFIVLDDDVVDALIGLSVTCLVDDEVIDKSKNVYKLDFSFVDLNNNVLIIYNYGTLWSIKIKPGGFCISFMFLHLAWITHKSDWINVPS